MKGKWTIFLIIRHPKIISVCLLSLITVFTFYIYNHHGTTSSDKLKDRNIVIDPGHGGVDGGAHRGEILEKDINLQIGKFLKEELEKEGTKVILTREEDKSLDKLNQASPSRHKRDLLARVQIINSNQPNIYLSIHVNINPQSPQSKGPMVFYLRKLEQGKLLGTAVLHQLNEFTNKYGIHGEEEPIGTKRFVILRQPQGIGILVEVGFLSNSRDRELLVQEEYQRGLAHAMVQGIKDYYQQYPGDNKQ